VEQGDAAEFSWPPTPCVIFLYNPFGGTVMQRVLERLAAGFRNRPSDLEILYCKAEQTEAFADAFELVWCEAIAISPDDLAADPVADPGDETRAYRLRSGGTASLNPEPSGWTT
jgi:hypothetical protein